MARPSEYTLEIAEAICAEMCAGKTVKAICAAEEMPSMSTVYRWLADPTKKEFWDLFAHAREVRMHRMADELEEIADDGSNDWMKNKFGDDVLNTDHVQRSRLRVDTKKWLLGKLAPRTFGDKLAVGGDPDAPPIQTEAKVKLDLSGLSMEELDVLEKVMRSTGAKLPQEEEEDIEPE